MQQQSDTPTTASGIFAHPTSPAHPKSPAHPTPVIIDTDPGIDDAAALALAFASPELDIRLITTVGGNVALKHVTANALKLLAFWKRSIPVAAGAEGPLVRTLHDASHVHGETGMEGFSFTEQADDCLLKEPAAVAMYHVLMHASAAGELVDLITLGPLTNVALLFKLYPSCKRAIRRIVCMGGSFTRGNTGVMSEFNIATDPEAAHIVFRAGVDLTMVGLDIGHQACLLPEDVEKLAALGKTGEMLASIFAHYNSASAQAGLDMYDPSAVAYALAPKLFKTRMSYVDIELRGSLTAGATLVDFDGLLGQNENVCVPTEVDVPAFRRWFIDKISKLEHQRAGA